MARRTFWLGAFALAAAFALCWFGRNGAWLFVTAGMMLVGWSAIVLTNERLTTHDLSAIASVSGLIQAGRNAFSVPKKTAAASSR